MRILYCIASFSSKGGTEKVLSSKASHLAEKGNEVYVLISEQHEKPFAYDLSGKVTLIDLRISSYLKSKIKGISFLQNIFILREIYAEKISEINPDVIVVLERGYEDFVIPYIHKRIPKIREYHFSRKASEFLESTMDFKTKLKAKFIRKVYENQYKKYDSVVCLTEKDKASWPHLKNLKVIPNIVDDIKENKLIELTERPQKIIAVGSMTGDRKGFLEMIDIWKSFATHYPQWTLHIYGDGSYRKNYEAQIKKMNLGKSIFLEGVNNNIREKYQESQIFLMTSKGEGLPMVIIEAQQNGVPVVVYDCYSGPSDIIKNNFGGFLIPMNDKKVFSEKLKMLLDDQELRKQKSSEAIENAKRYSANRIMPLWENLFKELKYKY